MQKIFHSLICLLLVIQIGQACPPGTWGISPCIACQSQCATCYLATQCDSCQPGYYHTSALLGQCYNCNSNCKTCTSNANNCTSCDDGKYLQSSSCNLCSSPCSKCTGTSTYCTDCVSGYYLSGSSCIGCSKPCATCTSSPTNCTTCMDSSNQNTPSCDCTSPAKYLDSTTFMCNNCISPCLNCSSSSLCDSCVSTYVISGNTCLSCQKPCANCSPNQTTCSTCIDPTKQTTPSCNCNTGYLINSTTKMCDTCTFPCASCQNNLTECYSCASTYTYDSTNHTCSCQNNQYEQVGTPKTCQNCSSPCLTCSTTNSNCNSCISGLNRHLSGTQCICDDTYYDNGGTCTSCILPCINCTSSASCTSCNDTSHQVLNDCHCSDTYYMDSSYICQPCVSPCLNCFDNVNCQSCQDNYYLSGTSCQQCSLPCYNCIDNSSKCTSCAHTSHQTVQANQCICQDGYYMDTNYYCQQCTHPCSKCVNSSTYCLSCASTFIDSGSHTCVCSSGQYENISITPSSCQNCSIPCVTCIQNTNHCLTCIDSNQIINSNSECVCKVGYVSNGNYCDQCISPCIECFGNKNNCTACKDIHHIVNSGQCVCEPGWINDSNSDCQQCVSPCQTCSINTNHCDSCVDANQIINSSFQCICKDTFYFDTTTTCASCVLPCANCDINGCLTCIDVNQSINSSNNCVCNNTYYMDGVNCSQCQLPCINCFTSVDCQSCVDPQQYIQNDRCVCNDGYYLAGNYCYQCQLPCSKCEESSTKCLDCIDPNHFLQNHQCQCKFGYGKSGIGGNYCSLCLYPCLECSNNINFCTSCIDKSLFKLENNTCVCQQGYYMLDNQCLKCAPQCKICETSADSCLECTNVSLILSQEDCFCYPGYYLDLNFECSECQQPCTTCNYSFNYCTSCLKNYQYLNHNKCLCQDGYYMMNSDCQKCNQICTKCISQNICTECIDGYYLNYETCEQCDIQCKSCFWHDKCYNCSDGYYMSQSYLCSGCVSNCKECQDSHGCITCFDGYYLFEGMCVKCSDNCFTCNLSYDNCTSCNILFVLINSKCECQDGYFESNFICKECVFPCKTCNNENTCNQCKQIANLQLNDVKQCVCADGFYWDNFQCNQCPSKCQTCSNQFECLSCDSGIQRFLKNNLCKCGVNYFENENEQCESCNTDIGKITKNCMYIDCNNSVWTYGEECDDGNDIPKDGCTNCKLDKYYSCENQLLKTSVCYQCPINCQNCVLNSNKLQCVQCNSEYFLIEYDCLKCSSECLECQYSSSQCLKCRFFQDSNGKCQVCESQQGQYSDYERNTCYSQCGDSKVSSSEECDDGNQIDFDGCDRNCKLEKDFFCKGGICIQKQYPEPQLSIIGNTDIFYNERQFYLTYNIPLNISNSFSLEDACDFSIKSDFIVGNITYNYEIAQVMEALENQLINFTATITLILNKSSENEVLIINFNNLTAIQSQMQFQQIQQVEQKIMKYLYVDDSVKSQVESVSQGNYYILYILAGLAVGSIIFGGTEIFFNLLDTIQMLSYLKYINTQFPYNLDAYFDLFGFAQLNFISQYLNIQDFFEEYIYDIKSIPKKIQDDGYTSFLIINFSSIISVWIIFILICLLSLIIPQFVKQFQFKYFTDFPQKDKWRLKFKLMLLSAKIFIIEFCYQITSEIFYNGIFRTHASTAYDYSFSLMLQLYGINIITKDGLVSFSSLISIIFLFLYLASMFQCFDLIKLNRKGTYKQQQFEQQYGSVIEGLNLNYFSRRYHIMMLAKKIIFMVILVFGYQSPQHQIYNLLLLSLITYIYLRQFQPFKDLQEYRKQIICEFNIILTLFLISMLAFDEQVQILNEYHRLIIGWICIFSISLILLSQLFIDIIQQWKYLFKKYRQIKMLYNKISRLFSANPKKHAPNSPFLTSNLEVVKK